MKRILVLGANGRVGRLVAAELRIRGFEVTAFVRNAADMSGTPYDYQLALGDVHVPETVDRALEGVDAVISTLGSWGTPTKDIVTSGMQALIPAMQKRGIKRVISLTGADSRVRGDKLSLLHRMMHTGITLFAGKILRDGEQHIALLSESTLDWTVVRSPVMNDEGTGSYLLSTTRPLPWHTLDRNAVACAIVDQLGTDEYCRKSPYITRP